QQRVNRVIGRGHDEFRHLAELDEEIPRRDQPEMARHRQRIALQRLWMSSQRLLPYVRRPRRYRKASGCSEPVEELNIRSSPRESVMRGLDPRIHRLRKKSLRRRMDCRVKPGNDDLQFAQESQRCKFARTKASSLRCG